MKQFHTAALAFAGLFNSILCVGAQPAARPLLIPVPREITNSGSAFVLDEQVTIAVPDQPSNEDLFLARMLTDELGDRFGLHLKTERVRNLDGGRRTIVMGAVTNPLVGQYWGTHAVSISASDPGPEGYVLRANESVLLVAGSDDRGAFYGLQSFGSCLRKAIAAVFRSKASVSATGPTSRFAESNCTCPAGRTSLSLSVLCATLWRCTNTTP